MDPESQNNIAFGSIYNNRVSMSDDTESGMLDYSKPEYASNFTTYVDSKISPLIQPYDNSMQTMKFSIGSLEDPYYSDLSTLRCIGRLQVLHSDGSPLKKDEAISVCNLFPEQYFLNVMFIFPVCQLVIMVEDLISKVTFRSIIHALKRSSQ